MTFYEKNTGLVSFAAALAFYQNKVSDVPYKQAKSIAPNTNRGMISVERLLKNISNQQAQP